MAKRKRLEVPVAPALETKSLSRPVSPPPIADVAGEAALLKAAEEVTVALEEARRDGRLVIRLALDAVEEGHLSRDRLSSGLDDEEMATLKASIRAHGQRTPIEVVAEAAGRFGLISGWRRLAALRALWTETGEDRFGEVLALVRAPETAGDAYIAMVEENEIRVGLSFYERAQVAAAAAEAGVFADASAAVDTLFAAGSKARRSKIRSFIAIHQALGDVLRFPADLSERLGLQIAQALKAGQGAALRKALTSGAASAEAEAAALQKAMASRAGAGTGSGATKTKPAPVAITPGLSLTRTGRDIRLAGSAVTPELESQLIAFLKANVR